MNLGTTRKEPEGSGELASTCADGEGIGPDRAAKEDGDVPELPDGDRPTVVDVVYMRARLGLPTSAPEILHLHEQVRKGVTCAHCGHPPLGSSHAQGKPLCHPDEGMDCYRLVTVYQHPMPCDCAHGLPEVNRGR